MPIVMRRRRRRHVALQQESLYIAANNKKTETSWIAQPATGAASMTTIAAIVRSLNPSLSAAIPARFIAALRLWRECYAEALDMARKAERAGMIVE
jgi:hypothetical protein